MWFAGVNGFNTVFIFQVDNPIFLPYTEFLSLFPTDRKILLSDTGHMKITPKYYGKDIYQIVSTNFPHSNLGPKNRVLYGFKAPNMKDAVNLLINSIEMS
jgi:hypothetical protein